MFSGLDAEALDELVSRGRVRRAGRGEVLFSVGDEGDAMMAVLSGRVLLTRVTREGKEIALDAMERGHIFGEFSLIDGEPRSADAAMVEAGELFVLQRMAFLNLLQQQPKIAIAMLGELVRIVRKTNRLVESVSFLELGPRLARLLLTLAERSEDREDGSIALASRYTQGELAKRIAASRESVSKQVANWERAGVLAKEEGRIVIMDVETINELADDVDIER
ncbi:transcriptional regulator, Crp/Fnr family protein [Hyphomonas johnsonii MHS-2]|uniref:Transcriptional regulator, Crp/Fnr family protein n=2 Tax=Hyphomonas johnsonii TaxID=81031 RepID=A0A059FSI8_9PROT|nr:transcriptional regulator, Crp/Fnr family protein [Hyphomonas johnsonii MHS-2]